MRNVMLVLLICLMAQVIVAKPARGLGLHFGTVSANGFSYRQFNMSNGFQITAGVISLGDDVVYYNIPSTVDYNNAPRIILSEDGRRVKTNLGLNYLYSLANNPSGRFYVFGGASTIISRVKQIKQEFYLVNYFYTADLSKPRTSDWENRVSYYVGMGLGFELNLGRNFVWAIEMPITLNDKGDVMMYVPQSGLYYFFK